MQQGNDPLGFSADLLLRHEPFVRSVVRGLLSDEGRVQDVLQETWLRVLRRGPQGPPSRSWLARVAANLALDSRRGAARREHRERAVARPEASEPAEAARQRLLAQREVVDAVLALAQPYRSVVLLRYFEDLGTEEIARRLERSPATVRSQLSRAHGLLRSALDERVEGGRGAWSLLLVPAGASGGSLVPAAALGAKVALAAGACVVGFLVLPRVFGTSGPGLEPARLTAQPRTASAEPPAGASSALASPPESAGEMRQEVQPTASEEEPPAPGALATRTTRQLVELAVQTQRVIEERLLAPDARLVEEHAAFLAQPDTGIVRLLDGSGPESAFDLVVNTRGGGAYWSFATREHSYHAEPDLALHGGRLGCGFYGNQLGLLIELGDVELAELPTRALPLPTWLPPGVGEAWTILWGELTAEDARHGSELRERTQELRRDIACPTEPSTFLLRVFSPDEHDHLVAFRLVARDAEGCTLLWRILATWPVPGAARGPSARPDEHREVRAGPRWLAERDLPELLALLGAIREQARGVLQVPTEVQERHRASLGASDGSVERSGFARILHRFRCDPLVELRGEGAYYSFHARSNSYDEAPELSLEQDRYSSGFAGNHQGLLLDLGTLPPERLASVFGGEQPAGLSEREQAAWDYLWSVRASVPEGGRRSLSAEDASRAAELGLTSGVPAIVGHTYLLRSVLFDSHDHLVAFTTVEGDECGHTLAWRILRDWPVEQEGR